MSTASGGQVRGGAVAPAISSGCSSFLDLARGNLTSDPGKQFQHSHRSLLPVSGAPAVKHKGAGATSRGRDAAPVQPGDRLLRRLQVSPLRLEGPHNVLQIPDRAGEAIDPGDHKHVTGSDEVGDGGELLAPGPGGSGPLLLPDHGAACGRQGLALQVRS